MTTKGGYQLLPPLLLLGCQLFVPVTPMNINDFFPDIKGNLTKVTWAHAVNSKTALAKSLNSSDIMMIEADVVYGKVNGSGESIPIMGHPPATQSDLSLEEFLITIYNFNKDQNNRSVRKGVKLDFKSTDVFTKSIGFIRRQYDSIDYPVWINADIIEGPLNPTAVPVDPAVFLPGAKIFNDSVLSLGWTTSKPMTGNGYSEEQIGKMIRAIKENVITQDITFAVRAGIAAQSFDQMKVLKDGVNNCTLTIWSSEGDDVVVPKLRDLIFEYGIERVFVDVPKDLLDRLDLGNVTTFN